MNASWAEPPGRHILAFLFRYNPVNERQLSRVAREAHSGVPFPPHLGKRTPVARVAHPCRSRTGAPKASVLAGLLGIGWSAPLQCSSVSSPITRKSLENKAFPSYLAGILLRKFQAGVGNPVDVLLRL